MKPETKRRYSIVFVLALAAVLLAVDQLTKYLVLQNLKPVGTVTVIDGLLEFSYLENTGAAFGLFQNQIWLVVLLVVAASIAVVTLLFRYKNHSFFSYATSTLLLAGGIGNLLDRIFYGYVVDFIHVMFFGYIFNVADCCITVGAVLFVIHYLFFAKEKGRPQNVAGLESPEEKKEE